MPPYQITPRVFFLDALANDRPKALAWVTDNRNKPRTSGLVKFYQPSNGGVLIEAEIFGLPDNRPGSSSNFYAMHIHEAGTCASMDNHTNPPSDNTIMPRSVGNMMPSTGSNSMTPSSSGDMMTPSGGSITSPTGGSMTPSGGSITSPAGGSMMPSAGVNMTPPVGGSMMTPSGGVMPVPGGHFNPGGMPHPFHAGDMPPLLSNQGYVWTAFFDRRFNIEDIIGKTVIIHTGADDFTTQPSGNSGNQLACGEIRRS